MSTDELIEDESPGWAAIDTALARVYGGVEPQHWGTMISWRLGGPDPLDGISAYPRTEPEPHWHFVSYGMSELYDKESENAEESGWGFEFTFRLARRPDETTPPMWAVSFLQNLARYVFKSGNSFNAGDHMNVNGPIAASREDSLIRAIVFAVDPELSVVDTPHGTVRFLQIIGLTPDEFDAVRNWRTDSLLEVLAPRMPLYITDIDRGSLLDPDLEAIVSAGIERDGSSVGSIFVSVAQWEVGPDTTALRFGALQAPGIATALRARLPHGNPLLLEAEDSLLRFIPGETFEVEQAAPHALQVAIPLAALDDFTAALTQQAGRRTFASIPGLIVEIVPTVMRDEYGDETGEVVG